MATSLLDEPASWPATNPAQRLRQDHEAPTVSWLFRP